jgi:hypothetical protein
MFANKYIVNKVFDQNDDIVASLFSDVILSENPVIIKSIFFRKFTTEKNKILLFIILCSLVYKYNSSFYETLDYWGQDKKRFNLYNIDNGDLVYSTFYFDNILILTFKGTSSIKDFLIDCVFVRTTDKFIEGKVHKGFHGLLSKNFRYDNIIKMINEFPLDTKIFFTGHSLGAALATLMMAYSQKVLGERAELVTFGCPRVGNSKFAASIKKSIRCVNRDDAVAKLPLPIRFTHTSTEKILGKTTLFNFSLYDHFIDSYYNTISF